jgi:excisionase family DNA binding protein
MSRIEFVADSEFVKEFLTKSEVAQKLNLPSTRVVEDLVSRGHLPAIRLGHRTVRFRWSDVEKTLETLTIKRFEFK